MKKYLWLKISHELVVENEDDGTIAIEGKPFMNILIDQDFNRVFPKQPNFWTDVERVCRDTLGYCPRAEEYGNIDGLSKPTIVSVWTEMLVIETNDDDTPIAVTPTETDDIYEEIAVICVNSITADAYLQFV